MGILTDSAVSAVGRGESLALSGSQRPAPTRISKYEIETEIGQGGVVRAFRALDRDTGRPVNLRVLTEVADRQLVERFRREAAIVARLHHRSIVGIYELGEHVGLPFVALQYLGDNSLLRAIQNQASLTLLQKMLLMWGVAEGLQIAHLAGLPHAGLRPGGIALGPDGAITLQDFGIVRLVRGRHDADAWYAAPEELDADFIPDALCDVFAYGAMYYELLTGERPSFQPKPVRSLAPDCPEALDELLERALSQERDLRHQSLEDIQCDAAPVLRGLKRARASVLLGTARSHLGSRQFEAAQAVVREIQELDPDNQELQELRAELRGQLQRRLVASRLEGCFRQAEEAAATRNFDRAVEILEAAARLDTASAEAQTRLDQMRSRQVGNQVAACLVAEARELLNQQSLAEAQQKTAEALDYDPGNPEADELRKTIGQALERREVETRVEQELARAKSLLLLQSFEEAITIIAALHEAYPNSSLVQHWLEHARTQQEEAERQAHLQAGLREARAALAQQRFGTAIALLEGLAAGYPDNEEVRDSLVRAVAARDRAWGIAQAMAQCQECCRRQQFEQALAGVEAALQTYPAEPALESLQREIQQQWRAFQTAAAVQQALEETRWLLGQDRPDLAVPLLRTKAAEFPESSDLATELASLERMLFDWERRRLIKDALGRVAALEQRRQWEAALTVLDEALEAYPAAPDLLERVAQVRDRLREQERRQKLARRLDAIGQKLAAQAWSEALGLLRQAQAEFPQEPELEAPYAEACAGLKRSECESLAAGVRQCLADGEMDRAEEILRQGLERYPEEAALHELRQKLKANRAYREEWRGAQVFFGRGQYQEAEAILVRLIAQAPENADAQAMLEAVRGARAASDEENFYERGREKAIGLIEERQFQAAADLLRNLLSLFPGDPILQRDLQVALHGGPPELAGAAPELIDPPALDLPVREPRNVTAAEPVPVAARPETAASPLAPPQEPQLRVLAATPSRRILVAIPLVLLAVAGAAMWRPKPKETAAKIPVGSASKGEPARSAPPDSVASKAEEPGPLPIAEAASRSQPPVSRPTASLPPPDVPPVAPAEDSDVEAVTAPVSPEPPRTGGTFRQPRLLRGPLPLSPQRAGYRGAYGVVVLDAIVDSRGLVTSASVRNGPPLLATVAKEAVLKWRYQPGFLNGEAVETKVTIRIVFQPPPVKKQR